MIQSLYSRASEMLFENRQLDNGIVRFFVDYRFKGLHKSWPIFLLPLEYPQRYNFLAESKGYWQSHGSSGVSVGMHFTACSSLFRFETLGETFDDWVNGFRSSSFTSIERVTLGFSDSRSAWRRCISRRISISCMLQCLHPYFLKPLFILKSLLDFFKFSGQLLVLFLGRCCLL